ncbi:MAG: BlaI/MecI/CopY family transcriptional regulator [Pseudomonadota bacterium]
MKPSPSELVILRHLWRSGAQSLREIHDAVAGELDWSRSSTRKTVERMVEKGLLAEGDSHGLKIFDAAAPKIATIADLVRSFASGVLGLKGPLPVSKLTDSAFLTKDELRELEDLLRRDHEDDAP